MSESQKTSESSDRSTFDDVVVRYLGHFGRYQKFIFFLVCLPTIITAMDSLSWTFTGAKIPHRCRGSMESSTADYWKPASPNLYKIINCTLEGSKSKQCPFEECKVGSTSTCPSGYIYDNNEIKLSAVQRWDIVCEKSVIRAVIQSTYYLGQMLGSLVFGFLGDRIGRKIVFFIALFLQFISGIGMALSPHWILYGIFRLFVGFSHPGIFVIAVVIGVELIGPKYRKLASVSASIFWGVGQIVLGILAYNIRDYRYLHAAIALPALVFISYYWIIPESARWLVAHKRYAEADLILQRAARINNRTLPADWFKELEEEERLKIENVGKKYNFLDLVRTPAIRKRTLAVFLSWPICSMLYYGISMHANFLGGDLYWTFILGGISEIPAVILTYFLLDRIGRKTVLVGSFFIASFTMISSLIIDKEFHVIVGITQSLISKSAMASAYTTLYAFTPELFPTVIRYLAIGGCSTMARFGAITASYISMWLVDSFGVLLMVIPFSLLGITAGIVIMLFLPETKGQKLPESIEDIENNYFHEMRKELPPRIS